MSDGGAEDLSARARRGDLASDEQRRLELVLDASLDARLLHRAGCEIDAAGAALAGDEAIVERIAERLLADRRSAPARSRRRRSWAAAAAVLCVAGAAAAGVSVSGVTGVLGEKVKSSSAAHPPAAAAPARRSGAPVSPVTSPPSPLPPVEPAAAGTGAAPLAAGVAAAAPPVTAGAPMVRVGRSSSEGAAALFAAAARARREGEVDKAIALYDVLQLRHPAAPESRAADIALGMLHGSRDRPGAALRHFRRYLARSPRGDLATEALWGEAQALASLGRDAEARRSLARLLGEHPESAYAPAARFRLGLTPSAP